MSAMTIIRLSAGGILLAALGLVRGGELHTDARLPGHLALLPVSGVIVQVLGRQVREDPGREGRPLHPP